MLSAQPSTFPAKREFLAIVVLASLLNILFQFFFTLMPISLNASLRALIETLAVAILVVPPAYYFYRRPLQINLRDRVANERTIRKSEMHYRIVSELTTTFVFDLVVDREGKISLDFLSDDFYGFAGRGKEEGRTFESLMDHIHPDDKPILMNQLKELVSSPQSREIECRVYVNEPHELRWLSICGKSEANEPQAGMTTIYGAVKDITERKRTEEEQARIRNLLAVSQRLAHLGSWEYDLTTQTFSWSDEMYRMARFPVGAPITREIVESFFPPDELARSRRFLSSLSKDFSDYRSDYKVKRRDGTSIAIHSEGEIIRDEHGNAIRIIGTTQDVTESKKADEALQTSRQIIEGLLNAIPAGVFWKDKDLAFLGCNEAFSQDAGFGSPRDLIGKNDYQMTWREQAELYRKDDLEVIHSGSPKLFIEEPHTNAEGETLTVLTSKVPLRDLTGEVSGVLGTYMDITKLRQTEKALVEKEKKLQESEAKYRKLIDTAPEAIYIIQEEKVVFVNNHAVEMLGYSREEMLGMYMQKLNYVDDWQEARKRYLLRAEGGKLRKSVSRHVTKDGKLVWVECLGEQIEWEGKSAVLYFTSDITDRKNAEKERSEYEKYLQHGQRLESLGVLAGGIAHDFNNILMGIYGFIEMALSDARDKNVTEYLVQAMKSMERARGLTQQLLTFSKGGEPVRRVEKIAPLVMDTCRFSLHGSKLKGHFDVDENLWDCNIDKNQVGQVIQNLMINAMQAMPMGGMIRVVAKNATLLTGEHPTLPEGDYVRVSIEDQGIGISEEMLPRIFDPFFTTKSEGHGLGLAISHSIIARHGGAIEVVSELGKGTSFTVHLPACKECSNRGDEDAVVRHVGKGAILVMDDEESVRALLSGMLRSFGYSVVTKPDGKSTLDYFKKAQADGEDLSAVMLDLTIPGGIGGKEVAEEIRKLNQEIPIFVSSGYAVDPIMSKPGIYGITASLSKPFTKRELMEMLEGHIGTKR